MEFDPHTLQEILQRIYQQMRCPQCGKKVPVDFTSIRVVSGNALLLQLKCDDCEAHIVLQASLKGLEEITAPPYNRDTLANASTELEVNTDDLVKLKEVLEKANGSFSSLFSSDTQPPKHNTSPDIEIV